MNDSRRAFTARAPFGHPPWPREHGAWAMLIVPLASGIALGGPRPRHLVLVLALLLGYLALAALRERLRRAPAAGSGTPRAPREFELQRRLTRWAALYGTGAAACGGLLLYATPALGPLALVGGAVAMLQLALVRRGLDRSLPGGVLAIAALALGAPAACVVARGRLDAAAWWSWCWSSCFFTGSLLFVRSLLRGRADARLATWSCAYHLALTAVASVLGQPLVALAFGLATARTVVLWRRRLRPAVIGAVEAGGALTFALLVVLALR